jgi:hypothetical protein
MQDSPYSDSARQPFKLRCLAVRLAKIFPDESGSTGIQRSGEAQICEGRVVALTRQNVLRLSTKDAA